MRIPAWRGFLGCGLVASVAYFLLPDVERIAAASSAVLHFAAAAAVVAGIQLHRPADRRPWYLIAAALLAFGTGDSLVSSPVRDLSDACFLGAYVALTIALLRLVRSRSHGRDLPALLDALVVTTGLGVVSWQFLMGPYARDPALSLDQKLTSILLPLADVVLLAVLVRLWSGGGQRPAAYWLLGLAVVALLAADTAFGVVTLKGPYPPGTPIDAGYITFLLACGAAALHPSMASVATLETTPTPLRPRWRLVLLGGAAILAPAVQMLEWMRGRPIEVPVVAAASIVMFLLIVARTQGLTRQVTVQDERRRLLGRVLQAAEDERTRIAHDLHDGPVQQLAVLNYDIYRARKRLAELLGRAGSEALVRDLQTTDEVLEGVEDGLGQEVRVLRHLMGALRPPVLDNRGFGEALSEHAKAAQVTGTVDQLDDDRVRLRVRDDGVGFDASNSAQLLREGHYGLAGMRERASLVGGTLEVGSIPGHGTTIEVRLPAESRTG